jgi:hypothetical protein
MTNKWKTQKNKKEQKSIYHLMKIRHGSNIRKGTNSNYLCNVRAVTIFHWVFLTGKKQHMLCEKRKKKNQNEIH